MRGVTFVGRTQFSIRRSAVHQDEDQLFRKQSTSGRTQTLARVKRGNGKTEKRKIG